MLYLTCTMISSVDIAHYEVSHAKDWVSVDCGTSSIGSTLLAYAGKNEVRRHAVV